MVDDDLRHLERGHRVCGALCDGQMGWEVEGSYGQGYGLINWNLRTLVVVIRCIALLYLTANVVISYIRRFVARRICGL